jgi:RNA polymerase sigma-70 factor (ECF subfamily)
VRGAAPAPDSDQARQREIVDAFVTAARSGDFEALLSVLDPDVVFRIDAGLSLGARPPITGAEAVAQQVLARAPSFAPLARPALVNGTAGFVVGTQDRPIAVVGFTLVGDRIVAIDIVTDADKLRI